MIFPFPLRISQERRSCCLLERKEISVKSALLDMATCSQGDKSSEEVQTPQLSNFWDLAGDCRGYRPMSIIHYDKNLHEFAHSSGISKCALNTRHCDGCSGSVKDDQESWVFQKFTTDGDTNSQKKRLTVGRKYKRLPRKFWEPRNE